MEIANTIPGIDLSKLPRMTCPNPACDSKQFVPTQEIVRISALLSPNGQAGIAQLTTGVTCNRCGTFIGAKALLKPEEAEIILEGDNGNAS
jgi:hypothetical protein